MDSLLATKTMPHGTARLLTLMATSVPPSMDWLLILTPGWDFLEMKPLPVTSRPLPPTFLPLSAIMTSTSNLLEPSLLAPLVELPTPITFAWLLPLNPDLPNAPSLNSGIGLELNLSAILLALRSLLATQASPSTLLELIAVSVILTTTILLATAKPRSTLPLLKTFWSAIPSPRMFAPMSSPTV